MELSVPTAQRADAVHPLQHRHTLFELGRELDVVTDAGRSAPIAIRGPGFGR